MAKPVSVFSAARRIGETSGWTLTNLQMQKICYMTHMYYLGQKEEPLIHCRFEAWDFGPVCPDLYHRLKEYGSDPIPLNPLSFALPVADDHPGVEYLDAGVTQLPRTRLVAITHWEKGAWHEKYIPGVQGIHISDSDILNEYRKRMEGK